MISIEELKSMNQKELNEELKKAKLELLKVRLAVASRQSKESSKIKSLKKHIARVKMLKNSLAMEQIKENPIAK